MEKKKNCPAVETAQDRATATGGGGGMTGSGRTRAENFDKLLDKGWARA